eukprot:s2243_g2.t1
MLQRPSNPDARDRDGTTLREVGTTSCMKLLQPWSSRSCAVADRNSALRKGKTALHLATQGGHWEIARLLLDAGAEKNGATVVGLTPLMLAVLMAHLELVQLLLDAGADKNIEAKDGFTPLHLAVQKAHLDVARLLLSCGVETNRKTASGQTSLDLAAQHQEVEVVRLLLESGAGADANEGQMLLASGLDIDSTSVDLASGQVEVERPSPVSVVRSQEKRQVMWPFGEDTWALIHNRMVGEGKNAKVSAGRGHLDASTTVDEADWFFAPSQWVSVYSFCKSWKGERQYHCLDTFSVSQKFAKIFQANGFQAASFDIKSDPSEDITTRSGFLKLLDLGMGFLSCTCVG